MAPSNVLPFPDTLAFAMERSKFDKTPHYFLPQGAFDANISRVSIMEEMGITQSDNALVDFVDTKARKVFVITASIEPKKKLRQKAMLWFFKSNLHDEKLPINKWSGEKFRVNKEKNIPHSFASIEGKVEDEDGKFWTMSKIYDFQEMQFRFLAPVLSTDRPNHNLWDHTLPFIAKKATYAEGSFGMVSAYTIHSSHVESSLGSNSASSHTFAVKVFKVDNARDRQEVAQNWVSEVKVMAKMNELNHKNIVRFITAFRRGIGADGGNLRNLWEATPKPQLTASTIQEVIKQLLGLAEALKAVHFLTSGGVYTGVSYRHGDLKPANILWFTDKGKLGTLKICDWGCAKNTDVVTAMRHNKISAGYATRRYEPPETETGVGSMLLGSQEKEIFLLYDIWSMGCIILEFIVWLHYGIEGLEKFNKSMKGRMRDDSPFYQFSDRGGEKQARVHNVVKYWMDYMAQDPSCTAGAAALGDLLEIVQRGLLVVKLPRRGDTFDENNLQQPYMNLPATQRYELGIDD
ncbi:MAG: hypothetical protein M1821_005107 [Bathelium mastoideum]|nr:MAG: hypothetical protein M1821_005107 [Bathelium mastoideum]